MLGMSWLLLFRFRFFFLHMPSLCLLRPMGLMPPTVLPISRAVFFTHGIPSTCCLFASDVCICALLSPFFFSLSPLVLLFCWRRLF